MQTQASIDDNLVAGIAYANEIAAAAAEFLASTGGIQSDDPIVPFDRRPLQLFRLRVRQAMGRRKAAACRAA